MINLNYFKVINFNININNILYIFELLNYFYIKCLKKYIFNLPYPTASMISKKYHIRYEFGRKKNRFISNKIIFEMYEPKNPHPFKMVKKNSNIFFKHVC